MAPESIRFAKDIYQLSLHPALHEYICEGPCKSHGESGAGRSSICYCTTVSQSAPEDLLLPQAPECAAEPVEFQFHVH